MCECMACVCGTKKGTGSCPCFLTQDAVLEDVADVGNAASLSDVVPVDGRAPKRLRVAVREAARRRRRRKRAKPQYTRAVRDLLV